MHEVPVFAPLAARRLVAQPADLDVLARPHLRIAADEALVLGTEPVVVDDEHAIDVPDGGWQAAEIDSEALRAWWPWLADWPLPDVEGPATVQGAAMHVPVKVLLRPDAPALLVVAAPHRVELEERWP